jgi:hypothetical protein
MKNGRENRTNGNEEEGEKEKEALRPFSTKSKGTLNASPKFLGMLATTHAPCHFEQREESWFSSMANKLGSLPCRHIH